MKYANSPDPQEMEQEISQSEQETEKDASHEEASQEPETSAKDTKEQGKDEKQSKTAKSTTTIEARIVHEETYPTIEGFGEEEAKAMRPIMQRFLDSYAQKPKDMADEEWLRQRLAEEFRVDVQFGRILRKGGTGQEKGQGQQNEDDLFHAFYTPLHLW